MTPPASPAIVSTRSARFRGLGSDDDGHSCGTDERAEGRTERGEGPSVRDTAARSAWPPVYRNVRRNDARATGRDRARRCRASPRPCRAPGRPVQAEKRSRHRSARSTRTARPTMTGSSSSRTGDEPPTARDLLLRLGGSGRGRGRRSRHVEVAAAVRHQHSASEVAELALVRRGQVLTRPKVGSSTVTPWPPR